MADSAITFTSGEVWRYYRARLPKLNRRGREWRMACPIHHGKRDSFAVEPSTGRWHCFSGCARGGDMIELEISLTGADFRAAKAEVFRTVGRSESPNGNHGRPSAARIAATYDYTDESGRLLYQSVRMEPKDFRQRRPDGTGGWVWKLDGVVRVPYRLPKLLQAETVYLPEGERDVETLEAWGLVASCNPGGSGNSHLYAGWADYFRGRHIVILPDNDEPGRKHAAAVAAALLGAAASVRVVEFPGLPAKGDVTDWRNAGGTPEQLRELTQAAALLSVEALSELRARWGLTNEEPTRATARAAAGSIVTRRLSDIDARPVSWLWPGRIARGKVSIIAGNPGLGKSQVTASIAAIITAGGRWPVDRSQCAPGDVVFLSAEDDPADTLRPRLEAAGAALHRVHSLDAVILGFTGEGQQQNRAFSLQRDIEALSSKLAELGNVAAVVIDPITAYLGDVDSHRNAEVRALLAPLSELAAQHGTAIIGVSHLNKSAGTEALMRVTGSLAFVAAARAAYLVAQDPENPARRLFLPMKNNIGPDSSGLAFRIEAATVQSAAGPLDTSLVVWDSEPVTATADEIMRTQVQEHGSALREAEEWLRGALSEPTPAAEISRMAEDSGISRKTLRRASDSLGIVKEKTGMKAGWMWSLTPKMPKTSEDAQQNCMGTFEEVGQLRESEEAIVEVEL
jgi:putative DNA primase/helicase